MAVTIIVDEFTCIGSGECVAHDPEAMALDDSGIAYTRIGELDEARATGICNSCPVSALSMAPIAD
jgi:ferredoxin